MIKKKCFYCNQDYQLIRSSRRFCSRKCRGLFQRLSSPQKCLICNSIFRDRPSHRRRYCSMPCYRTSRKGKNLKPLNIISCKECGKSFVARRWQVKFRGKKYCSKKCTNLNPTMQRDKHWNWQGGITPINKAIRNSLEYEEWRTKVLERDLYTCQQCGQVGDYLQVDHIKPFALYPKLRLELSNGQTLCIDCHAVKTKKDMKFIIKEVHRYATI